MYLSWLESLIVVQEVVGSNPTIHPNAPMVELVVTLDLGSSIERCVGSSPTRSTIAWLVQLKRIYYYG